MVSSKKVTEQIADIIVEELGEIPGLSLIKRIWSETEIDNISVRNTINEVHRKIVNRVVKIEND